MVPFFFTTPWMPARLVRRNICKLNKACHISYPSAYSGCKLIQSLVSSSRAKFLTTSTSTRFEVKSVKLPTHSQVVISGAGAVGNSVAYHLVKNGWTNVVVLEQGKIGGGVSWRGCGIVGHFHSSSEGIVTKYSSNLYRELQDQGYDIGFKATGAVNLARSKERMVYLQRLASEAKVQGLDCEVIGPSDIASLHQFIQTSGIEGGVWVPGDAVVNPLIVCNILARLAQDGGAHYFEDCPIMKVLTNEGKVAAVETCYGTINCDYFVLCSGMWSRKLGQNCVPPLRIPIHPAEFGYVITEPVLDITSTLPIARDYDAGLYCRESEGGFLVGGFPQEAKPVFHESIPPDFQFKQLPVDWTYFKHIYDEAKNIVPVLNQVKVKQFVNGPDTFTPDGRWILGETSEVDNIFVAVGMNGNSVQSAGGLGKELADWIITGGPKAHLLPFDIRRFIELHNNNKFLRERVKEAVGWHYKIHHPLLAEFQTARKLRCSPLYTAQKAAGAVFGERMGFERALYFDATKSREEHQCPSASIFGKPPWLDCVKEEYFACRERVGIIDMSSFSKFHLKSGGTEVVDFLQLLCSNDVDVPVGNIISSGMQNEQGGYENDCLLVRRADNCYFMMSPTAQQTRLCKWMHRNLPADGSVSVRDVTSLYTVLNVVGPKSKELMMELTQTDMSLPNFTCRKMNVGYASDVLVMGFNNTGEPGFSLYIPSEYALHVYNKLMTVGRDYGIKNVGYYALRFLRIEKFIPFWGEELDSNTSPLEVGRGFKVKMQKEYFLGKFALQHQLEKGLYRRLIHFQLDGHNPDMDLWPWGKEPIYRNGKYVGMTTSSGYGFTLGHIVCLGFVHNYDESGNRLVVTSEYLTKDAKFEIEIAGQRFSAKGSLHPPKIPFVSMDGSSIKYVPKPRARLHATQTFK